MSLLQKYYYPPVNFWSVWFSEMMLYFFKENGGTIKQSDSILDVGCGLGNHCFNVLSFSPNEVFGFDISKQTIQLLNDFGTKVQFDSIDICVDDVSEFKGRFNVIFSGDVYEHVNDPNIMLKNMNYLLKEGGIICLTFPNEDNHGHNQVGNINDLEEQLLNSNFKNFNIEVVQKPSFLFRIFTRLYLFAQNFSDRLFKIKRSENRRPESDEFQDFYAYTKIQKLKDKKFFIAFINFIYEIVKKISRISKPYIGNKDYNNLKNKRFILFASKTKI